MWLLSSWTNFRVTASSMICFTCRAHRGVEERPTGWGVLHPPGSQFSHQSVCRLLGCLGKPLFLPQPLGMGQICAHFT